MTKTKPVKNKRNSNHPSGSLSPEDRALWARITNDVTPLAKNQAVYSDCGELKYNADRSQRIEPHGQRSVEFSKITTQKPSYGHGHAPGLDRRTQMRLRRGQLAIEARLDLHGMAQQEAHERVCRFLKTARNKGCRTVLVITGKGRRQDGGIGVLRSAVPRWLNEPPLRDWIKAFDYAAPRDGGEGALYILLRRCK